jgi:DNA-directed RNA polymerase specialized sigma24 family protein
VTADWDAEFTQYVTASEMRLRRLAYMLSHDWHGADDLVQATITRLYVRWHRAGPQPAAASPAISPDTRSRSAIITKGSRTS